MVSSMSVSHLNMQRVPIHQTVLPGRSVRGSMLQIAVYVCNLGPKSAHLPQQTSAFSSAGNRAHSKFPARKSGPSSQTDQYKARQRPSLLQLKLRWVDEKECDVTMPPWTTSRVTLRRLGICCQNHRIGRQGPRSIGAEACKSCCWGDAIPPTEHASRFWCTKSRHD